MGNGGACWVLWEALPKPSSFSLWSWWCLGSAWEGLLATSCLQVMSGGQRPDLEGV